LFSKCFINRGYCPPFAPNRLIEGPAAPSGLKPLYSADCGNEAANVFPCRQLNSYRIPRDTFGHLQGKIIHLYNNGVLGEMSSFRVFRVTGSRATALIRRDLKKSQNIETVPKLIDCAHKQPVVLLSGCLYARFWDSLLRFFRLLALQNCGI
jgi:hypothetical protein